MMKWNKVKSNKGETLIETLVSILIAALSVALLTTSVLAAARINKTIREADEEFYSKLAAAELRSTADSELLQVDTAGNVLVFQFQHHEQRAVQIDIYGNDVFATYIEHEFE